MEFRERRFINRVMPRWIFYTSMIALVSIGCSLLFYAGHGGAYILCAVLLWRWDDTARHFDEAIDAAQTAQKQQLELHLLYYNWLDKFLSGNVTDEAKQEMQKTFMVTKEASIVYNQHAKDVYGIVFRESKLPKFYGKHTDEV